MAKPTPDCIPAAGETHMRLTRKKKFLAIGAGVLTAGALTTAAFAYWTSTGSGSGSASTKSAITVTLTGDAVSDLVPGAAQNITGTVDVSDGATSAYVGTVTPSIDTANTTFNADCGVSDFTFTSGVHNAKIADGATGVAFGSI